MTTNAIKPLGQISKSRRNYLRHREHYRDLMRAHRLANPHKVAARSAVAKALKGGLIVRPESCSDCGVACVPHGHHNDYEKQLDVEWLCRKCHYSRHKNMPRPKSILKGERVGTSRLTAEVVIDIRRRSANGLESNKAMARRLGVDATTVDQIVRRQTWKHL